MVKILRLYPRRNNADARFENKYQICKNKRAYCGYVLSSISYDSTRLDLDEFGCVNRIRTCANVRSDERLYTKCLGERT
jgi:hypothetical protein